MPTIKRCLLSVTYRVSTKTLVQNDYSRLLVRQRSISWPIFSCPVIIQRGDLFEGVTFNVVGGHEKTTRTKLLGNWNIFFVDIFF
jgi:hypothetical protein